MPTASKILENLEREPIQLRPLRFTRQAGTPEAPTFLVEWPGNEGHTFIAWIDGGAAPRTLEIAARNARSHAFGTSALPLVVVPYLSPAMIEQAEEIGVSAVDLCGNGIIQVPQRWLVVRVGQPNRFRGAASPRHNAYRGAASLVSRLFAAAPWFRRVSEVHGAVRARGGKITFGTVSKALGRLEDDLVIARGADGIRLLQPETLLDKLRVSYRPPEIRDRLLVQSKLPVTELAARLRRAAEERGGRLALTGISSASAYAVIATEPVASFYTSLSPRELLAGASIDPRPQRSFPDLELLQTDDDRVYFDTREDGGRILASPVQTWLELITGDKRSQEVALDVKERILRELARRTGPEDHGGA